MSFFLRLDNGYRTCMTRERFCTENMHSVQCASVQLAEVKQARHGLGPDERRRRPQSPRWWGAAALQSCRRHGQRATVMQAYSTRTVWFLYRKRFSRERRTVIEWPMDGREMDGEVVVMAPATVELVAASDMAIARKRTEKWRMNLGSLTMWREWFAVSNPQGLYCILTTFTRELQKESIMITNGINQEIAVTNPNQSAIDGYRYAIFLCLRV